MNKMNIRFQKLMAAAAMLLLTVACGHSGKNTPENTQCPERQHHTAN